MVHRGGAELRMVPLGLCMPCPSYIDPRAVLAARASHTSTDIRGLTDSVTASKNRFFRDFKGIHFLKGNSLLPLNFVLFLISYFKWILKNNTMQ